MNKILILKLLVLTSILTQGCRKNAVNSLNELNSWMTQTDNGLSVYQKVNGLKVTVKYLPEEYLAYKDLKESAIKTKIQFDSLKKYYSESLTFMLTIGPDEEKGNKNDIMFTGIKNYKEYAERSQTLNFDMEQFISLNTDNNEYKPVLSALENIYGIKNSRNLLFVFAPKKEVDEMQKMGKVEFVYADELFALGTLHFEFDLKKIKENKPKIDIKI